MAKPAVAPRSSRHSAIVADADDGAGSGDDNATDDGSSNIEMRPLVADYDYDHDHDHDGDEGYDEIQMEEESDGEVGIEGDLVHSRHGGEHFARKAGTATQRQVAANIFISFVGAGMLGMPYAFSLSGWLLGTLSLSAVSAANVYAMLLLVKTRKLLESRGHTGMAGYGDVGRVVMGAVGERLVNACLVASQLGFATAYIIFIAANLHNIAGFDRAYVCFGCVPVLAMLVQVRHMKTLTPTSLVADAANLAGITAVFIQDLSAYRYHLDDPEAAGRGPIAAVNLAHLVYVTSVSIYSLEGVALVLPLESSCAERDKFPSLLIKCICGITTLMATFGCAGYAAFGADTQAPITLNLQGRDGGGGEDGGTGANGEAWATFVKLALCLGLYLTYPIMMFPVHGVLEEAFFFCFFQEQHQRRRLQRPRQQGQGSKGAAPTMAAGGGHTVSTSLFRAGLVFLTATVAYAVPDFGKFLGLVGSSICVVLGFILPCVFHLVAFDLRGGEIRAWEIVLDICLIVFGVVFGAVGTYNSFRDLSSSSSPESSA